MFDELHDPTPPKADTATLAAVAERAARMRRRRTVAVGSLAAVGLVGASAMALILAADRDSDERFSTSPAAATSVAPEDATGPSPDSAPVTTGTDTTTTTAPASSSPVEQEVESTTPAPTLDDFAVTSRSLPSCLPGVDEPLRCPTFVNLSDGAVAVLRPGGGGVDLFETLDPGFGFDPLFEGAQLELLAIGPGDIGYISWAPDDPDAGRASARQVSAVELTGLSGRAITTFDTVIDGSDDIRHVATERGLVAVECCTSSLLPAPDAPVVVPWVDASGDLVVDSGNRHFRVEISEDTLVVRATSDELTQAWTLPAPEGLEAMPVIVDLDDGTAVYVFEPLDSAGLGDVPVYLHPDGTSTVGEPIGAPIVHVLPDGRFITRAPGARRFSVVGPFHPPASTAPGPPLTAIDTSGDAVYFPTDASEPVIVCDGPVIGDEPGIGDGPNAVAFVSVAPDESVAYAGLCCSPIVGTVLETRPPAPAAVDAAPVYGSVPVFNPSGAVTVAAGPESEVDVRLVDGDRRFSAEAPAENRGWQTAWDVTWLDDRSFAVLGSIDRSWMLTVYDLEGPDGDAGLAAVRFSRPFAGFGNVGFEALRFAGQPADAEIAVHEPGSDVVLAGTLDDYGNNNGDERGSSLRVDDLPGPSRSVWFSSPEELVRVDADGVLTVDALVIAGTYTWARR